MYCAFRNVRPTLQTYALCPWYSSQAKSCRNHNDILIGLSW